MSVAAMLLIVGVLWIGCLLSIGYLAWTDAPEDLGHVSEGWVRRQGQGPHGFTTPQLRVLQGGKR